MKKILYMVLLLSACKSNPDKKTAVAETDSAAKAKPADTTFLKKEVTKDVYHIVYIEKNRAAKTYQALLNFKFDRNDSVAYKESYKILKIKNRKPLKKYDLAGLPADWVPLRSYKGKYYLYSPSNWGNVGRRILTDSTILYRDMEGPDVKPLLSFKKVSEGKYIFSSLPFYQFVKNSNINIYIIDKKNKVAVWEDTSLPADYRYGLFVAKENAANFDMVVNYCKTEVTDEFALDKIDFKTLIKGL